MKVGKNIIVHSEPVFLYHFVIFPLMLSVSMALWMKHTVLILLFDSYTMLIISQTNHPGKIN